MNEYKGFYEVVKKWTVNDYRTQGIKSEVIIDMLISDFIEEMIAAKLNCELRQVKLLAKEFPIDIGSTDLRNAKVDYLVAVGNRLYLVELKTTEDSHSADQRERMIEVISGEHATENMLAFFSEIVKSKKRHPSRLDSKKYFRTVRMMQKIVLGYDNAMDIDNLEKRMIKKFSSNPPGILYIELKTPNNDDFFEYDADKKIDFIALDKLDENENFKELLSDEKKQSWDCIESIVRELLQPIDSKRIFFMKSKIFRNNDAEYQNSLE